MAAPACGSDHGALAKGSNGGQAGRGGQGGSPASGGFTQITNSGGATGSGGRLPDEPPGENVLTLVHGIVDAGPVLLCFAKGSGSQAVVLGAPEPPAGLAYGASWVVRSIEGVDFTNDSLSTWIITGDLSAVAGLDCEQALALAHAEPAQAAHAEFGAGEAGGAGGAPSAGGAAAGAGGTTSAGAGNEGGDDDPASAGEGGGPAITPPVLRAARLPTIPAGTLAVGRSTLFVADGCVGGAAFTSRLAENACGAGYSATAPTLGGVLVQMSRRSTFTRVGLQVVHASLASGPVNVTAATPAGDQSPLFIASNVQLGAILPRFPDLSQSASSYGVTSNWQVELYQGGSRVLAEPWQDLMTRAGLSEIPDGKTFALVVLGPGLGLPLSRPLLWNPSRIALVPTDP